MLRSQTLLLPFCDSGNHSLEAADDPSMVPICNVLASVHACALTPVWGSTGDILSCVSWGVSKGARPKCDCILLSCASSVAERTYFSEFAISFCPATVTSISFSRCRVVLLHYAFLWRGRADPCFWSRWLMWARTKLFFSRVDCICEGLSLLTAWFLRGWYSLLIQCITCGWVWWTVSTRGSLIFRSLFSKWAVVGLEYTLWFASLLCITRLLRFPLHGKGKSSAIKM